MRRSATPSRAWICSPERSAAAAGLTWVRSAAGGTAAVLWPTQGAIGRRLWSAHDEAALRHFASFADFDKLTVERDRVDALRSQLHDEWSRGRTSTPDGGNYDRRFLMVHGEQDYWFLNSCADVCAEWVEVLGCEVSWVPIRVGLAAATE